MFPYFRLFGMEFSMTSVGIIVFLICFLIIAYSLCKKWHQNFYKLFYSLPFAIFLTYVLGAYVYFFLNNQGAIIPNSWSALWDMLNPYGYHFHFVGILAGILIAMLIFFKSIKRDENKKIWADILFFSIAISIIPLGICLVFGDNFIGKASSGLFAVKPLTLNSELNKFGSVFPVGIFVSMAAIFSILFTLLLRQGKKDFGTGLIGFVILLILTNVVFMYQQAPRYGVLALGSITFDIRQYLSLITILLFLLLYYNRNSK